MAYTTFSKNENYGPRKGLEGPFSYPNGRVIYYDASCGQYWDPTTDIYLENDEVADLQSSVFDRLRG